MAYLSTILASIAVFTSSATAATARPAGAMLGVSPATPTPNVGAEKRYGSYGSVDYSCLTSVNDRLAIPTPGPKVLDALDDAAYSTSDFCTVTMAGSLSPEYGSWIEHVRTWYTTVVDDAESITTDCGALVLSVSLINSACSTSLTAFYTDSSNSTATSSYDKFTAPTTLVYIGSDSSDDDDDDDAGDSGGSGDSGDTEDSSDGPPDSASSRSTSEVTSAIVAVLVLGLVVAM